MSDLRLMTYNLRIAAGDDGEPSWAERRDMVASMIRFHAADVVGVQEALPPMLEDLSERLDAYSWIGTGRDGRDSEYSALFFRPDRISVERHNTFWLSETPSVPGSRSWDASYPRIVTWAQLSLPEAPRGFYVFNTHFDHDGSDARRESARLLRARIDTIAGPAPLAVVGDFNATPDSAPYRLLTEAGDDHALRDALSASLLPHHGPTGTFNGFETAVRPHRRIDYIFVRGPLRVRRHGVLSDRWDGHFPSDHCPVLAELLVPPPPSLA